jgi:hypothetical protein
VTAEQLIIAADYWPASTGLYLWHEFTPAQVAADLAAVRASGIGTVRVHLAWDAFMPSDRQVNRYRLRDMETLLDAAREVSLGVIPVLFAQSFGDSVMLPMYAVDRRRPRRGVRVVCDGNVVTGGPRDLYTDPLMLEVATRWIDGMLGAFANHPAIAAWDLGHDPATTIRPRRIAQLAAWTAEMAGRVRAHQDACWLTLGAADVLSARGVRLAAIAPYVDVIAIACSAHQPSSALGEPVTSAGPAVFVAQLAQRLAAHASDADTSAPLLAVVMGIANGDVEAPPAPADSSEALQWDVPLLDPTAAARYSSDLLTRLEEIGTSGIIAGAWTDTGPRTLEAPPCDRAPSMSRWGLVDTQGRRKPITEPWSSAANREPSRRPADPWPASLDVDSYYANLPESVRDLAVAWRRERESNEWS